MRFHVLKFDILRSMTAVVSFCFPCISNSVSLTPELSGGSACESVRSPLRSRKTLLTLICSGVGFGIGVVGSVILFRRAFPKGYQTIWILIRATIQDEHGPSHYQLDSVQVQRMLTVTVPSTQPEFLEPVFSLLHPKRKLYRFPSQQPHVIRMHIFCPHFHTVFSSCCLLATPGSSPGITGRANAL